MGALLESSNMHPSIKSFLFVFLAMAGMLSTTACNKDDGNDPCLCARQHTGDFKIEERLGFSIRRWVPVHDTGFYRNDIRFTAFDSGLDSVQWQIGADPKIRTDQQFVLEFDQPFGRIYVTLKSFWTPNRECFPDDPGQDSISKVIHLVDVDDLPIWGTYRGSNSSAPQNQFEIELLPEYDNHIRVIRNLPEGCPWSRSMLLAGRYFAIVNNRSDFGCYDPKGVGFVNSKDSIQIDYGREDPDSADAPDPVFIDIPDFFAGTRI